MWIIMIWYCNNIWIWYQLQSIMCVSLCGMIMYFLWYYLHTFVDEIEEYLVHTFYTDCIYAWVGLKILFMLCIIKGGDEIIQAIILITFHSFHYEKIFKIIKFLHKHCLSWYQATNVFGQFDFVYIIDKTKRGKYCVQ